MSFPVLEAVVAGQNGTHEADDAVFGKGRECSTLEGCSAADCLFNGCGRKLDERAVGDEQRAVGRQEARRGRGTGFAFDQLGRRPPRIMGDFIKGKLKTLKLAVQGKDWEAVEKNAK